jgi:hypothetical protein
MINQIVGLGSFLLDIAAKLYPDSKDINSAANVAGQVRRSYNVVSTTSVHESANRAIIAPMVAVEASLLHQEFMSDLMQIVMLRDIVATLTHIALQGSVGLGVKVENIIGGINPNRAGMMSLAGCESLDDNIRAVTGNEEDDKAKLPEVDTVRIDGKNVPDMAEYTPLAVGKVVMATLYNDNGTKIDFPLTFRQIPVPLPAKDLKRIFSAAKIEEGFFARLLMAKTKEITYPEFLSGRDIIKDRFNIRNEEMSGYYKEAQKRENGNKLAAVRTGLVSFNSMANTFIMSKDAATQLELDIGKRFNNASSREGIFKAVVANTIVVCDEDRGIYTFYTHGSDMHETYTRKDIAIKSKKDSGSNTLADLVKLLNGGM